MNRCDIELDTETCKDLADYAQHMKAAYLALKRTRGGRWFPRYPGSSKGKGKHRFRRRKGNGKGRFRFKKRANVGKGPVLQKHKARSFGKPSLSVKVRKDRLAQIQANSYCKACGAKGHWLIDAICPKTNSSSSSILFY